MNLDKPSLSFVVGSKLPKTPLTQRQVNEESYIFIIFCYFIKPLRGPVPYVVVAYYLQIRLPIGKQAERCLFNYSLTREKMELVGSNLST